ncbi:MAG: hypothetical protein ACRECZ_09845, partial [Methylocella sp.]
MQLNAEQPFFTISRRLNLDHVPPSREFSVAPAADKDLPYLAAMTARHIPNLKGTYQALEQVQRYSQSILAIKNGNELVGCFAALFLNDNGLEQLLDGGLSVAAPSQIHLVRPGETAAAIYVWALCMPGIGAGATGNIMQWLRQDEYVGANLYARPTTPKGKAF